MFLSREIDIKLCQNYTKTFIFIRLCIRVVVSNSIVVTCLSLYHVTSILHCHWWKFWWRYTDYTDVQRLRFSGFIHPLSFFLYSPFKNQMKHVTKLKSVVHNVSLQNECHISRRENHLFTMLHHTCHTMTLEEMLKTILPRLGYGRSEITIQEVNVNLTSVSSFLDSLLNTTRVNWNQ